MMKKVIYVLSAVSAALLMSSCTTEEALEVQKFPSPGNELSSEEYYRDLREWKQSPHARTYVYYAAWAPLEGASSMYKEPINMSERFIGLPDSLDIVNLWMGVPSADPADEYEYSPVAAADMKYCQTVKGTRFVMHADASHYNHTFVLDGKEWTTQRGNVESIEAYADYNAQQVLHFGLDGIDYDFEGWSSTDMTTVIKRSGKYFGPQAETEEGKKMLNIIDYWSSAPSSAVEPYVSYIVRQAYSEQLGGCNYRTLNNLSWLPSEKLILCEQWNQGNNRFNGGYVPCRGYNGETLMTTDDSGATVQMASLEAYARFCMDGNAGGFGAYYIDKDYFFDKGTFYNLRRCINIADRLNNKTNESDKNE